MERGSCLTAHSNAPGRKEERGQQETQPAGDPLWKALWVLHDPEAGAPSQVSLTDSTVPPTAVLGRDKGKSTTYWLT